METKEKIRRSYIKPRVTQVKLEIQEATLTACKRTATGTGPSSWCTSPAAGKCKSTLGS
jgi:hypothetical protein